MKGSCPQLGPAHPHQGSSPLICCAHRYRHKRTLCMLHWAGVAFMVLGMVCVAHGRRIEGASLLPQSVHARLGMVGSTMVAGRGVVAGTLTDAFLLCCAVLVPDDHCTRAGPGIPAGPPAPTGGAAQGLAASTVITDCTVGSSLGEQLQRHLVLPWPLWCNHNSTDAAAPWVVHHPRYCVP